MRKSGMLKVSVIPEGQMLNGPKLCLNESLLLHLRIFFFYYY